MSDANPESRAQYQVITTLGQGGMARVLLTVSRGPAGVDKLLVVKELKDELKSDPEFVTMFLDEARIAARLNHPNVIQTYEVGSDGDHPIIVMEYLEGQALTALLGRIGRKAMPLELHVHILAQTAVGLHYAHELRSFDGAPLDLVHRDVSPHNVFVTYDGLVKLVDFGIAKAADSARLTRAGQFKGKLGYASPEQLDGTYAVDRRTDIFALGVMLWEALARRRLTFGEAEGAVMKRRLEGADLSIRDAAPDAPEELVRICETAMAFDPRDRFATAADFRAALEAWLDTSARIGAEEIGALVRETFAADREKIRGLVDARIKSLAPGEIRVTSDSLRRVPPPEPSDSTMKASSTVAATPAPERSRGLMLVAAGIAVAVAVSALTLMRGTGGAAADPSASAPSASAPAGGAAQTIEVSISADPPEARVFLDDVALASNPFHGALPKSAMARRLRATAPGYAPEERIITLDRDVHLELALRAVAAAPGGTAAASHPPSSRPGGPMPAAKGAPTGTASPGATPGEALPNPARKKPRSIDTDF